LPGIYQVKVTASGFATVVLDNVEVGASVEKSLDVRMEVSSSAQTITATLNGTVTDPNGQGTSTGTVVVQ